MIVAMQELSSEDQIQHVIDQLVRMGFEVHRSTGARQTVLGGVGAPHDFDIREVEMFARSAGSPSHLRALQIGGTKFSPGRYGRKVRQWRGDWVVPRWS